MKKILVLLPIVSTIIFCMIPNFFPGIPYASDEPFHMSRIMSLADALREGLFPAKVHPNLCYGLGYGVGFFYDDALIYFPAILVLTGISLEISYKIFILCVFIAISATMFYSCKKLSNNNQAASFAAAIFLLSNRIVGQLYVDFTIGNLCGAIFLPLAIAGIYIWIHEKKGLGMFIIGFTGLMYCHAITTILAFSVCLLIAIVNIRSIFGEIKKLVGLILSSIYIFLITMAYWLPMWQQFHVQTYKSKAPWTTEEQNVISPAGLITDTRGIGILIVLTFIISIAFALIIYKKYMTRWSKIRNEVLDFLVLGATYMAIPCIHIIWHLVNLKFTLIQFPARLFMPASVLIIFAFSIEISVLSNELTKTKYRRYIVNLCTLLCIIGTAYIYFAIYPNSLKNTNHEILNEVENYSIAGAGAGQEWLPIETDLDELKNNTDTAIADDGSIVIGQKINENSQYVFRAELKHQYYDVPYIYYRGYTATDENGVEYEVDKNPQNGLVRIFILKQQAGNAVITIKYQDTKYAKLSYAVSLIALAAGVLTFTANKYRNRKFLEKIDVV